MGGGGEVSEGELSLQKRCCLQRLRQGKGGGWGCGTRFARDATTPSFDRQTQITNVPYTRRGKRRGKQASLCSWTSAVRRKPEHVVLKMCGTKSSRPTKEKQFQTNTVSAGPKTNVETSQSRTFALRKKCVAGNRSVFLRVDNPQHPICPMLILICTRRKMGELTIPSHPRPYSRPPPTDHRRPCRLLRCHCRRPAAAGDRVRGKTAGTSPNLSGGGCVLALRRTPLLQRRAVKCCCGQFGKEKGGGGRERSVVCMHTSGGGGGDTETL